MNVSTCVYSYDPLDRLVSAASASEPPSQRFYQGQRLITEIFGATYTCLFQCANQLLAQRDNEHTLLLATDVQRSVLSTDKHTHQGYSPYGQRTVFNGLGTLLGFNGEQPDPVTGHYLLGNGYRAYNPVLMRFNSPDLLSPFLKGGINAYAYCAGDPLNWHDSTGRFRLPTKLLSMLGAAAGVSPTEHKSLIKQVADIAKSSLTRNPSNPELVAPGRVLLDEGLGNMTRNNSFTQLLSETNKNLISNADPHLSVSHAGFYLDTAKEVESGGLSNTSAHFSAAAHWLSKTQGPSRPVGTLFNAAAGFIAAGNDHRLLKTGRMFQQVSTAVRR